MPGRSRSSYDAHGQRSPHGLRSGSTGARRSCSRRVDGWSQTARPWSTRSSSETGKTREDAQLAELFFVADAFGFWAKRARKYLADERIRPHSPLLLRQEDVRALPPVTASSG